MGEPSRSSEYEAVSSRTDDHSEICSFRLWNHSHRRSVLTEGRVKEYLVDFKIRTTGKNKAAEMMGMIKDDVNEATANPYVQRYLSGSKVTYDNFKGIMVKKCKCPGARVAATASTPHQRVTPPSIHCAASASSKSVESPVTGYPTASSKSIVPSPPAVPNILTSVVGINLSESESESEKEEMEREAQNGESDAPPQDVVVTENFNGTTDVNGNHNNEMDLSVEGDLAISLKGVSSEEATSPNAEPCAVVVNGSTGNGIIDSETPSPLSDSNSVNEDTENVTSDEMEIDTNKENERKEGSDVITSPSQLEQHADVERNMIKKKVISDCGLQLSDEDEELDYEYDNDE